MWTNKLFCLFWLKVDIGARWCKLIGSISWLQIKIYLLKDYNYPMRLVEDAKCKM